MNWIYFDVETERAAHEVGGWANIEALGLAVAVTFSSRDNAFRTFRSSQVRELGDHLSGCDCLVGFNSVRFDVRVLQPYLDFDLSSVPHLDLMLDLKDRLGVRPSLDACCRATLGTSKSASGLQSLEWWREGRHDEVIAYCQQDVEVTRRLHEHGARHGWVKWTDRNDHTRTVEVDWSLDSIHKPLQPSLFD